MVPELSKTWSANSRSAVEHAQHMVAPVYEVECELVDENGSYMAANTDVKIARSILMKSQLLLGRNKMTSLSTRCNVNVLI